MEGVYLHNIIFLAVFSDSSAITLYVILGWGEYKKSPSFLIQCHNFCFFHFSIVLAELCKFNIVQYVYIFHLAQWKQLTKIAIIQFIGMIRFLLLIVIGIGLN